MCDTTLQKVLTDAMESAIIKPIKMSSMIVKKPITMNFVPFDGYDKTKLKNIILTLKTSEI